MRLVILLVCIVFFNCKPEKKYHDEKEQAMVHFDQDDKLASILAFQKELNAEYKDPETSPLPDRYRKNFESLDFYEPDTSLVVTAILERTPDAVPFLMPTTTARKSKEVVYGNLVFQIDGKTYRLAVYQNQELMLQEEYVDYLFFPFTDLTNGEGSYTGGRYIDLRIPENNTIEIDFNKAYNPYCAYNKKYSCPIVPSVNALPIAIAAGVKDFKKGK